jgi:enoyl-CoA hydratase
MQSEEEVILAEQGRAGLIRLNRPKALNALTLGMIRSLEAFYHRCAKSPQIYGVVMEAEGRIFSAGGDIRAIYGWLREKPEAAERYYAEEYRHIWTLQCFRKPHVALINGVMMGGGVGVCLYGTHRVAGENMRFAMPETGIGFFPDIGASWFFPRMPGKIGLYLALTGSIVNRADAYYLGLVTHCIASEKFDIVKSAMIDAEPVDTVLDELHVSPEASVLEQLRPIIDRCFSADSVEDIIARLEKETGDDADFARATLETLSKRSPLSLKATFEQLRRGKDYKSLKEALSVEYRIASGFVRQPDLLEGIRAVIIDKDQAPRWQPPTLGEVDETTVLALFAPPASGDLNLPDPSGPPKR